MQGVPFMPPRAPVPPKIEHPDLQNRPIVKALPAGLGLPGVARHPIGPADPGYRERIPPPGQDGQEATATALIVATQAKQEIPMETATSGHVQVAEKRILVTFGPEPGTVVVGVEVAPDWEMEEDSVIVPLGSVVDLLPILSQLARVKNMTGRRLEHQPTHEAAARDAHPNGAGGAEGGDAAARSRAVRAARVAAD